jgi:hypothetical protein
MRATFDKGAVATWDHPIFSGIWFGPALFHVADRNMARARTAHRREKQRHEGDEQPHVQERLRASTTNAFVQPSARQASHQIPR